MRSVDDQLARVLDGVRPLNPIDMGLVDARGCILAEDVRAPWPLPPFDNSAMDGYAVAAAHLGEPTQSAPLRLKVIDDIPAGTRPRATVGPGTAARIMTGAPMPYGADAVVPVELTDGGMPVVTLFGGARVGQHVRRAGDDVHSGATVLNAGTIMEARQTALAAAVGRSRVVIHPRPRVVVLTTGSELVEPGRQLGPGMINDVNGSALAVAAAELGAEAFWVGPVPDDAEVFRNALEDQLVRADLVITTGGVSVGAYDTVKKVLSSLGTVEFVRVAMQPGMPQGHGHIAGVPIFNLPGNPVSAMVSFEVFVRPVLRRMLGFSDLVRPHVEATVTQEFDSPLGKRQFARGQLVHTAEGYLFHPAAVQQSHQVAVLAHATGLAVVPEQVGHVVAGTRLPVAPFGVH
ncbi:MAG: molybdopterin molybdotransferase MoeA [Actinobacteria bacterium]|nr:molybdopterin molybdotransferase MoeA [Actinomycetota bacterium]MCB9411230.1 molybdopterin molybdotransferase MoeA [Actinomycetota bacterium]